MNAYGLDRVIRFRLISYLACSIAAHIIFDLFYRPLAIQRSLFDFGLSGSFTQMTAIAGIACIMLLWEVRNKTFVDRFRNLPFYFFIVVPPVAMMAYEFIQIWLPTNVFDLVDLLYSLLGGLINWIILKYIIISKNSRHHDTSL